MVSCSPSEDCFLFSVATHNAYCFFDGYECEEEFDGFLIKDGYTEEAYRKRVKKAADFYSDHYRDADVILFQEVENTIVLKDILEAGLIKRGFKYYGAADSKSGYLNVGFVSKIAPEDIIFHGVEGSRLIMELVFAAGGERIHLFNIHASSRLDEENAGKREDEFSLLRTLLSAREGSLSIVLGDFNTDLSEGDSSLALKGSGYEYSAPLVITGDGGEARSGIYYSPAADKEESLGSGTCFYNSEWSFFDSAVISEEAFDFKGFEYASSRVISPSAALDVYGFPRKFDVRTGEGFSDHLGFMVSFRSSLL